VYRSFGGGEVVPDTTSDTLVADGLLKLDYHTTEVLRKWCSLQTSYPDERGGYSCIPGDVSALPDGSCVMSTPVEPSECADAEHCRAEGDLGPVDCDKAFLCRMDHCECYEAGCAINGSASAEFRSRAQLSLRRAGDELIGVVTNAIFLNERGARTPLGRIRFQREP